MFRQISIAGIRIGLGSIMLLSLMMVAPAYGETAVENSLTPSEQAPHPIADQEQLAESTRLIQASQSALPKFSCDGTVYHIKNDKLYRIDISDGSPTVSDPFLDYSVNMNSLGFNPLDNYLYMQTVNRDVLRVGSNGSYENLGRITGINEFYFVGDFLRDGTYILGNGRNLYAVDLSTMTVVSSTSVTLDGKSVAYSDIAVSPIDGQIYAKLQNNNNVLVTIDLTTGEATSIGPSYSGNSGSVWFDTEGQFYAYSYTDGNFYKIDTADGSYEILGTAEKPTAHDATSCPYGFELKLDMADVACPDEFWQDFRAINRTNEILSDLIFKQTLPEGFTYAESESRLETTFANNFGNGVTVDLNGRSLIVNGLTAAIGQTEFQLKIAHDGNTETAPSFRANIEGLPALYGEVATSDDPDTAPKPDATIITVDPCDPGPEPPESLIPVISCDTDGSIFNTAYNPLGGVLATGEVDSYWTGAVSDAGGPTASTPYAETYVVAQLAGWAASPFANAEWISILPGANMGVGTRHVVYRYQFEFDEDVDPSQFALEIDYFADDYIVEVYVNGVAQSSYFTDDPEYGEAHQTNSYSTGQQAALTLNEDWQDGQNTIEILTFNVGTWEGFLAQARSVVVCPQTDYGDAPATYGGAKHTIVDEVYLGNGVDNEAVAAHSSDALGDDAISDLLTDDEDGVTISAVAYAGGTLSLTVWGNKVSGQEGYVRAWADYNGDGQFGAAELLDFDQDIDSAVTTFNRNNVIDIPADSVCGQTYVRVRYSLTDNMTSTGSYSAGETEDYALTLLCGEIEGYLWDDEDGSGLLNGAELQLGGTISLYDSDRLLLDTVISTDGSYLFSELPFDTYTVAVTDLPTGYLQTADPDDLLDSESTTELATNNRFITMNFGYRDARFDIGGTVWYDIDADGAIDAAESGFENATVKLISADLSGDVDLVVTTDATGRYNFFNVTPGEYLVEADQTVDGSPLADYQATYDADGTADGVTSIVIDLEGNISLSSESGEEVQALDFGFTQGDITVQIIDLYDPIRLEETAVWEVRVASLAPAAAVSVTVKPDESLLLALNNSAINIGQPAVQSDSDWDCDYIEADGTLYCDWLGAIYPVTTLTNSQVITLSMRVPGIFPADSFTATAAAGTSSVDTDLTNNNDSAVTSVDRSWVSEPYTGDLGLFTHVQYDEDLVEDPNEIEQDLFATILNPLQVPISVTFGLTATDRPMLVVTHCLDNSAVNCLNANTDAYIPGTIIIRDYTIHEMKQVISTGGEATNLVTDPFTVTLGADSNQGRTVVNSQTECEALSGEDCLLPYEITKVILAGLADDAPERPIYEWQSDEYTVINLYTKGGRLIEIAAGTALIEDDNAKPGLYKIEGTMTIRIEFDDIRLGEENNPYIVDQLIDIEVYLRIIAPFVESEN